MKTARLSYLDFLKGLAIFLVVMGHVLTICIRQIDSALLFKIIGQVHMPIFFFISGYFTGKTDAVTGKFLFPHIWKRFTQLVVPMILVSTLWIYYYPYSGLCSPFDSTWSGLWTDLWKNGYWFPLTLFAICVIYAAAVPLFNFFNQRLVAIISIIIAISAALNTMVSLLPESVVNAASMPFVAMFFPIFILGVLCRIFPHLYTRATESSGWFTTALVVTFIVGYYILYPWDFPELPEWIRYYCQVLIHPFVVIIAVHIAKRISVKTEGNRLYGLWCYLGRKSLAIYLLHYFFLFPMGVFRAPLREMNLDIVPTLFLSAICAAIITAVTLGVNYIIGHSPLLSRLLTGSTR